MKANHFAVLTIILINISGCSSISEKEINSKISKILPTLPNLNLITVDLDTLELKVGRYSDIYDQINYVPLETNDHNLIGTIEDIQLYNDTLYILDSKSAKSIFVFTLDGKFIRRIGKVGRGPGEWLSPSSFTILEGLHKLFILDNSYQKIFVFSTKGSFIQTIDLPDKEIRSQYIRYNHGKLYLDARIVSLNKNKPQYLLRQIGLNGIEEKRWLPVPAYSKGWNQTKEPFYFSGNSSVSLGSNDLKFVGTFMDTIFSISEHGVQPALVLKSNNRLTEEKVKEISKTKTIDFLIASMQEKFVWAIKNFIENDDIIRFKYSQGNMLNEVYLNKKTKLINHFSYLQNDVSSYQGDDMLQLKPFFGTKKMILGLVPNHSIPVNASDTARNDSSLFKNPVLFIARTK